MIEEEIVKRAQKKMRKTIEIANTVSIVCVVVFLAVSVYVALDESIGVKDGLIALLAFGIIILNIIHLMGYWKQKAIFDVSIALLRFIEINHPDIEMPPIRDPVFSSGVLEGQKPK
jgi:flagellar biosynthesis protein FliQ